MKKSTFEANYDRFVTHYNDRGNKLAAFAELSGIRQGIDRQAQDSSDALSGILELLDSQLFFVCSGDANVGVNANHDHDRDRLFRLKDEIIDHYRQYQNPEATKDKIAQLHQAAGSPETVGESTIIIDSIVNLRQQEKTLSGQAGALAAVVRRIALQAYPKRVKLWAELSEQEKQAERRIRQDKANLLCVGVQNPAKLKRHEYDAKLIERQKKVVETVDKYIDEGHDKTNAIHCTSDDLYLAFSQVWKDYKKEKGNK